MDLENQAAESGLDSGNAGGETRSVSNPTPAAPSQGLSLKESMAKAASTIRERTPAAPQAREVAAANPTAFEKSATHTRSPQDQAGSQEEVAPSILEAPKHWPQKRRDAFGRFVSETPDLAKEWLDHTKELEGEFTRKSQEHAEHRKFADSVRELFTPEHRTIMQQNGVNEQSAIKWLLEVDGYARKDPAGYAKWFMQQAGLTPQQLFPEIGQGAPGSNGNSAEAEWIDPELTKTREELGSLKSQIQQLTGYIQQLENGRREEGQKTVADTIQQFQTAADESGNPLYPHFEAVEERMTWELKNNPELRAMPVGVEKLKAAYDIAVWANPTTRQAMLDAKLNAEQAEAAKRQAADRARAAQTLKPKVASVAGASQVPPTDLRSLIKDAASRARG